MESFYILDGKDDIVLEHNWRGRSFRSVVQTFISERFSKGTDRTSIPPVLKVSQTLLFHIKTGDNTMICISPREIDSAYVFDLMRQIALLFEEYLGVASKTSLVQNNLDTITELLYEVVDNGFPMTTESNGVRDVVLPPSLLNKLMNVAGIQSKYEGQNQISTIPWRRAKVKYTSNEIFMDIVVTHSF